MAGAGLELAAMLVEELRRGREWAVQLQGGSRGGKININNNDDEELLFSYPQLQPLLQKIISSLEKSITLLNSNFNLPILHHHHHQEKDTIAPLPPPPIPNNNNNNNNNNNSSSPLLLTTSSSTPPTLEVSYEGDSPKPGGGVFKKRKTSGSQQVRVCSATGLGGGLDDGHSWRKYGQKDILGANHPRAYYRCTHRYMQGCMAKKHIQRSDADPSIFEVTYKGTHTCTSSSSSSSISAESRSPNGAQQLLHQLQKQDEKQHGLLLLVNSHGPTETDLDDGNIASGDDIFPTFVSPASSDDDSFMNFSFLFDQNDNDYCFEELTQFTGRSESDSSNNSPFADWHLPAAAAAAADDDDHHQVLNLDAIDIWEYFS